MINIDQRYQKLQQLLAAGKWREANQETARVMRQVAGKENWLDELDEDSINQFPCEDLRQIDGLWVQYSNGRFGFSVQKRIWQECGGKVDYETRCRLGDLGVGEGTLGMEIDYDHFTFTAKAPPGHLPGWCYSRGLGLLDWFGGEFSGEGWLLLLSRPDL